MTDEVTSELLELTERLLQCISAGDWESYQRLCDPTLTAFEPEACGHLVEGLGFHQFYFDQGGHMGPHNSTLTAPHVRLVGDSAAVVSYVRLIQFTDSDGRTKTNRFEETRVWEQSDGQWRHVHFHRSSP